MPWASWPGEKVQVLNVNNGERLETYVIEGERGTGRDLPERSGRTQDQGGHIVIIVSYARMALDEARTFRPTIIFPDERTNQREP